MIAVDTNILVRALVNDPAELEQTQTARTLLSEAAGAYISRIVQVETVWVLESAYKFSKADICKTLEHLLRHPLYLLQAHEQFSDALSIFSQHSADFSDCLILAEAKSRKLQLFTFDKKLGRLKGAHRVIV